MENVETIKGFLVEIPACFSDCVSWARNMFQQTYTNEITRLLFQFPPDLVSSEGPGPLTGVYKTSYIYLQEAHMFLLLFK